MTYLNFEHLESKGLSVEHFICMLMVLQKESLRFSAFVMSSHFDDLVSMELLSGTIDKPKLTKLGKTFLTQVTTFEFNDDISRLAKKLQEMYEFYGVSKERHGKFMHIVDRISWFTHSTPFDLSQIYYGVESYLKETETQYVVSLDNLFWKPQNVFSVKPNIKDSKLFEYLCEMYEYDISVFFEPHKEVIKITEWLQSIVNITIPKKLPDEMYFTGSYKGDVEAKRRIKSLVKTIYKK